MLQLHDGSIIAGLGLAGSPEINAQAIAAAVAKVIGDLRNEAKDEQMHLHRYFPSRSDAAKHVTRCDAANELANVLEFARDRLVFLELALA